MFDNTTNQKLGIKSFRLNSLEEAHKIADTFGFSLPATCIAADIMTADIKFLTLDDTVRDFLAFMKRNKVRHVVVFDPPNENETEPYFVGIVSERDVLRIIHPYADKNISILRQCENMGMPLVRIVTRNPICVSPETPIDRLITVMVRNSIDMVPVFDESKLVGIVTTQDILELIVKFGIAAGSLSEIIKQTPGQDATDFNNFKAWVNRTADSIMPEELYSLCLENTLENAIDLLKDKGIRHLIVTHKNGQLAGVISDRDILRHLPFANISSYYKPKNYREDVFCVEPDTLELNAPLANIMTWEPIYITEDCTVVNAADILYSNKLSCLPVLSGKNKISGIITVTDLMKVLRKAFWANL